MRKVNLQVNWEPQFSSGPEFTCLVRTRVWMRVHTTPNKTYQLWKQTIVCLKWTKQNQCERALRKRSLAVKVKGCWVWGNSKVRLNNDWKMLIRTHTQPSTYPAEWPGSSYLSPLACRPPLWRSVRCHGRTSPFAPCCHSGGSAATSECRSSARSLPEVSGFPPGCPPTGSRLLSWQNTHSRKRHTTTASILTEHKDACHQVRFA